MRNERLIETVLFLVVVATILLTVFLSGCATDDPERMQVQARGTMANHDNAHCRAATLNRAQPASAVAPC